MLTINDIKSLLSAKKPDLMLKYNVKSLGVFGSYCRGEQTENSDIDILVEFSQPIGLEIIDMAEDLEKLLHKKVDLVSKKAIKPRLMPYIEEDLIYV